MGFGFKNVYIFLVLLLFVLNFMDCFMVDESFLRVGSGIVEMVSKIYI